MARKSNQNTYPHAPSVTVSIVNNQSSISQIRRQLGGINLQIPCSPDPLLSPCSLIPCALPPLVPLWLCLNYAKQTQFSKRQNYRNLLCHTELQQYSAPPHPKKQSQTKPIPPTQCAAEALCGAIRHPKSDIRNARYRPNGRSSKI